MRSLEKVGVKRGALCTQQARIGKLQFTGKPRRGAVNTGEDCGFKNVSAKNAVVGKW